MGASATTATCKKCGATWRSLSICHCSGCCETFSGISAFDHHRTYYTCRAPKRRGLELIEGVWHFPGSDERFAA